MIVALKAKSSKINSICETALWKTVHADIDKCTNAATAFKGLAKIQRLTNEILEMASNTITSYTEKRWGFSFFKSHKNMA